MSYFTQFCTFEYLLNKLVKLVFVQNDNTYPAFGVKDDMIHNERNKISHSFFDVFSLLLSRRPGRTEG